MKKLIIVRHGSYEESPTGGTLNEYGVSQILDAIERMKRRAPIESGDDVHVFSTGLSRAVMSADLIGNSLLANTEPSVIHIGGSDYLSDRGSFNSCVEFLSECEKDTVIFVCHLPNIEGFLRNFSYDEFRMSVHLREVFEGSVHSEPFKNGEFFIVDFNEKIIRQ